MLLLKKISFIGLGVFLLGLFVSTPYIYAQEENHDSEDLENVINDYRKNNSKVIEALNEANADGKVSHAEALKIMEMQTGEKGLATNGPKGKLDPQEMIKRMIPAIKLINQRFGSVSYEAARTEIETNISQTPAKGIFKAMPKGVDFITKLVRDDKALIASTGIFTDKKKLYNFLIINVVIFIFGFFILRKSRDASFFEKVTKWFIKKTLLTSVRLGVLIYFFGTELGPTWNIFQDTFF
jgi:hypothetical protein